MGAPRILLHANQLSERGSSVNIRHYSRMLERELGMESVIAFHAPAPLNNWKTIREMGADGLRLFAYNSFNELQDFSIVEGITHAYFMSDGRYTGHWIPGAKKLTHAVFRYHYHPHGEAYAHVSEWLSAAATSRAEEIIRFTKGRSYRNSRERARIDRLRSSANSPYPIDPGLPRTWVPHCVYPQNADGDEFRQRMDIPKSCQLVGRIGGFDQFDDPAAKRAVSELVSERSDIWFCFVNTRKFMDHPRVIHVEQMSEKDKWSFYAACDLFLNGRLMGESFGFSIVEPLSIGKPVIAPSPWRNPRMDKHHIAVLRGEDLTYRTSRHLTSLIARELRNNRDPNGLMRLVDDFMPRNVARRFQSVFLDS